MKLGLIILNLLTYINCVHGYRNGMFMNLGFTRRETLGSITSLTFPHSYINDVTTSPFEIRLNSEITERSCLELADKLKIYERANYEAIKSGTNYPIALHITSMGGDLMPTMYICDLICSMASDVYTFVDGYAASAASLISVCGKKRFITKHSSMLLHQLTGTNSGKYSEMQDNFNSAVQTMRDIKDIYLSKTLMTEEFLDELLMHDVWLNSSMCLKYGLVDEII